MKMDKYLLAVALSCAAVQVAKAADSSHWPTSVEDNVSLTTGQRVYLPVLDNDIGEELVLFDVNTTTVELGSVSISDDSKGVYYQSADNFVGDDSFWYAFKDNLGRTNAAQVFINVSAAEEVVEEPEVSVDPYASWPTAVLDAVSITKNETIIIPVLDNDTGLELSLTAVNNVTVKNGSATIDNEQIIYTPYLGFTGEDSFWYQFTDARGRANSTQVKVTISEEETPVVESGISFTKVAMHYGLLNGRSQIYEEQSGTYYMSLAQPASIGANSLLLADDYAIKDGQLITYLSDDGDYYTVETNSLSGRELSLAKPLPANTTDHIWNFYDNAAHPNFYGYFSIADFALREHGVEALNSGKHLMLGDSWFQSEGIEERLKEKLPNAEIINKGVGGRTSGDILSEFENDTRNEAPNFVWLIAGTNDYFQRVDLDVYIENMRSIIEKINEIGAQAIVIDSSIAPLMYGSDELTILSHSYADAVDELLLEEN